MRTDKDAVTFVRNLATKQYLDSHYTLSTDDQELMRKHVDLVDMGLCFLSRQRRVEDQVDLVMEEPIYREIFEEVIRKVFPCLYIKHLALQIRINSSSRGINFEHLVFEVLRRSHQDRTVAQLVEQVAGGDGDKPGLPKWCSQVKIPLLRKCRPGEVGDTKQELEFVRERPVGVYLKPTDKMGPDGLVFLSGEHAIIVGCKLLTNSSNEAQLERENIDTLDFDKLYQEKTKDGHQPWTRGAFEKINEGAPLRGSLGISIVIRQSQTKRPVEVQGDRVTLHVSLNNWRRFDNSNATNGVLTALIGEGRARKTTNRAESKHRKSASVNQEKMEQPTSTGQGKQAIPVGQQKHASPAKKAKQATPTKQTKKTSKATPVKQQKQADEAEKKPKRGNKKGSSTS